MSKRANRNIWETALPIIKNQFQKNYTQSILTILGKIRILPFWIQSLLIPTYWTTLKDQVAFAELSHVKNCGVIKDILCSLRKQVTKITQYIFW